MNKKRKQALKNTNAKIVWTKNYESELLFELLMKNKKIRRGYDLPNHNI
ncbi:hypothetical protein R1O88_000537 [Campylobacter upsaliensis]|nr:hypothetical protein [Campylobacter upsaliensis]